MSHAIVCIEDLRTINKYKLENEGTARTGGNTQTRSILKRPIVGQWWTEFSRQLESKMEWSGGKLVRTAPGITCRRICPKCDQVQGIDLPTKTMFHCEKCGYLDQADLVGSSNILRAGLAQIACEVNGAITPSAAGTTYNRGGEAPYVDCLGILGTCVVDGSQVRLNYKSGQTLQIA